MFGLGTAAALVRFGLADHLQYLEVLRTISRSGEAYYPNQSVNGVMNRVLGNGAPAEFSPEFAPYHPVVYFTTLVSSLLILALALRPWRLRQTAAGGHVGLLLAVVAATMASPVAWQHHYGALLPVFAAAVPDLIRFRPLGRLTGPLFACSYLAAASTIVDPNPLEFKEALARPWVGLVSSHLFFGGLLLFALLLALRSAAERQGNQTITESRQ